MYRYIEWLRFGRRLHSARSACLGDLNLPKVANQVSGRRPRALFLGDGDGRLLKQFAQLVNGWAIYSVDSSHRMLLMQRRSLRGVADNNLQYFLRADSRRLPIHGEFDLVFAAFHLDCFHPEELASVIDQVDERLAVDGLFYVVDFVIPDDGWRRWWAKLWVGFFIRFFRCTTDYSLDHLPDHRGHLGEPRWTTVVETVTDGWISTLVVRRQRASSDAILRSAD